MKKIIKAFKYMLLRFKLNRADALVGKNCVECELEIDRGAHVRIEKDCILRNGVIIKVRDNAHLHIGEKSFLNHNCIITARKNIVIGNNVAIGPNCCFFDHNHNYHVEDSSENFISDDIIIGNNVWLGANCIILKGTVIGDNSVIGANTVLSGKKIPPNSLCYDHQELIIKHK